jgi:hypothetical protein
VTVTVKEPAVETVIDWVVAPVDQRFPVGDDELSVIEEPGQNPGGPVIRGFGGAGLMVTGISLEGTPAPPQVGVDVQTRRSAPVSWKSAPLMMYDVPFWAKRSVMIPPGVVRYPH